MTPGRPLPGGDQVTAPYWEALRNREFVLPWDRTTGRFIMPIAAAGNEPFEWRPAPRDGAIVSFSWIHVSQMEWYSPDIPYVVAVVELDRGPQLMANIVEADEDDIRIGGRVTLVFEARAEGWVVPQFTPIRR